jgi:predicted nucleic acid-binding protein
MSAEFVDTNILVYAHDGGAGEKHNKSVELLARLFEEEDGALSVQVLAEFYSAATKKLGMRSQQAEEAMADLAAWAIHCPGHADLLRAARLHRRYKIAWWDALVVNSAIELGCSVLWSEDLAHGQRYGSVTVRNPFA